MTKGIAPAYALAHIDPNWFDRLSDIDRLVAAFDFDLWLRPEQRVPTHDFNSCGWIAGRGLGKSFAAAIEINRRVQAGECRAPALMAPNESRVQEVQVKFLVDTSPPWFKAEAYSGSVRWPNGIEATAYTPEAPGRPRSGNHDLSWLCELVDWAPTTRLDAFQNLATATRVGKAQIFWDTTSKGKNEVIQYLLAECERDPIANVVRRGSSFDNPLLSRKYLRKLCSQYVRGSRRYNEEVLGLSYAESAGALWCQAWLDDNRIAAPPVNPELVLVSIDPSLSDGPEADEAGVAVLARDRRKHIAVLDDLSGRQKPEKWAAAAVERCMRDATGVLYERNHAGDMPRDLITLAARERGLRVEVLGEKQLFPPRRAGTIYIKSITSRADKGTRAEAPAACYQRGLVHHVGTFELLEAEMTSWEPGMKSPNRLDAVAQGVTELAELRDGEAKRDTARDIEAAARLQKDLRAALGHGGRRLGF